MSLNKKVSNFIELHTTKNKNLVTWAFISLWVGMYLGILAMPFDNKDKLSMLQSYYTDTKEYVTLILSFWFLNKLNNSNEERRKCEHCERSSGDEKIVS